MLIEELPKQKIIRASNFSYGFDPLFQERYLQFYKDFITNPEEEIRKLSKDPVKYIEFLCKTVSKDPITGMQQALFMELMPHQKVFVERLYNEVFLAQKPCCILKSRQQGASWILCFFCDFVATFYPGQNIVLTTMDKDDLYRPKNPSTLMGKVEYALNNHPQWFMDATGLTYKPSTSNLQIIVGESIISGSLGNDPARGQTAVLMLHDEFDAHSNQEAFVAAVGPACSANIYVSTLNRKGSRFDHMTRSKEFVQLRIDWKDDLRIGSTKEARESFRRLKIAEIGLERFNKEYEMQHSEHDDTYLVEKNHIEKQRNMEITDAMKSEYDGWPVVCGMDCAGYGKDLYVLRIRKGALEIATIAFGTDDEDMPGEKLTKRKVYEKYILPAWRMFKFEILVYDVIGVGHALADFFKDLENQNIRVPFHHQALILSSSGMDREDEIEDQATNLPTEKVFLNLRSRLFWTYRENIRKTIEKSANSMEKLYVQDERVLEELQFITYTEDKKIQIISKKDLKKKLAILGIKSPDFIDADVYTIYANELYLEKMSDEIYFKAQAGNY